MANVTRKYFTSDAIRVKHTPITRRYGVRCSNPFEAANNRVWPGEIGTLTRRIISGNGWSQTVLEAEFSHGRTVRVAYNDTDTSKPSEWVVEHGFNPEEFITVKGTVTKSEA